MLDTRASKSLQLFLYQVHYRLIIIDEIPSTIIFRHSERIIRALDRFIFFGEAYEAITYKLESNH
jgi:hypothetical protein